MIRSSAGRSQTPRLGGGGVGGFGGTHPQDLTRTGPAPGYWRSRSAQVGGWGGGGPGLTGTGGLVGVTQFSCSASVAVLPSLVMLTSAEPWNCGGTGRVMLV